VSATPTTTSGDPVVVSQAAGAAIRVSAHWNSNSGSLGTRAALRVRSGSAYSTSGSRRRATTAASAPAGAGVTASSPLTAKPRSRRTPAARRAAARSAALVPGLKRTSTPAWALSAAAARRVVLVPDSYPA